MLNNEQKTIISDHINLILKQMDKINKKGDITPDELNRTRLIIDEVKDYEVICAMEDYGKDPEEEMYSSMGYYGRNSRTMYPPMYSAENYSARGRNSMGQYTSRGGYSRNDAYDKMRSDLEMKLNSATDEREREMIMKCLRSLDN